MRILAVTNMYPSPSAPARGVFVQEQIKGLGAIGLEVQVAFVDRRREGPLTYYRLRERVGRAIREFRPDAIHVMYGGVLADQMVRHYHVRPLVVTFHGSDLLGENLSGWWRKLIARYGVWCSRRAARAADAVVIVARHLFGALKDAVEPKKVRVIPCGIDLGRFKPLERRPCQAQLGWNPRAFHVLFASSNGDPVKRPWLAKAAVARLDPADRPAELHYLAGIPNSAMPIWLNGGDVLLLSSQHEGSPTIVKEALACGVPVVSVDVGDVAERLDGLAGCYLARPDAEDLAAKLELVRRHGGRLDCGRRLETLSLPYVARQLQACYEDIKAYACHA